MVRVERPPLWRNNSSISSAYNKQSLYSRELSVCLPVVGNEGELCCTALSSRRSLSSSERLLPRAEVMAAVDESDDFCLFGKLKRQEEDMR